MGVNGVAFKRARRESRGGYAAPPVGSVATPSAGSGIVPIPIRAVLTVHIQGLPFDLSHREAKKIANVILAMAMTDD